ncbi:FAD binding domain-containing protein [Albimonas pacifica]|uniref:Carbon-monoxide dehydrogenase medium subunit n=1 Tax=Albimonas pacifica TaxID=1114924 RepID=A0A1I3D8X8_9RHOB|nr:FAD binding domain-containing protein [Albimonas pacifica]SFH83170.1 carbon-monoxide dehydrogenase medium subunit [Albimonas pacifica]
MYSLDFVRPASLAEAVTALQAEDALPLGGGQTLIPALRQRLAMPGRVVALAALPELVGLRVEGGEIRIRGATPHARVAAEAPLPALARLAGGIGDPAVRHRGTIGGSLANNDPAACWPAAVLGLGGVVRVRGLAGPREIAADAWFRGLFDTDLRAGEIVTEVRLPLPLAAAYVRFRQPASRFALAGVFVARFAGGRVRVAVTGASASGVYRWTEAEQLLASDFSPGALAPLCVSAEGMLADVQAPADYRAHLVKVIACRAVAEAASGRTACG